MSFRNNLQNYAVETSSILEIGPLDKAVFRRPETNVFYADHLKTDLLKKKYENDPDVHITNIPEIDFDLSELSWDAISKIRKFDLIFASHVVEHIADPIQWLNDLSLCLNENGKIVLVVPDKRFTFDFLQKATSLSELLQNHSRKPSRPSKEMVTRYFERVTVMRPKLAWMAPWFYRLWAPKTFKIHASEIGKQAENQYVDVHCHFWTPQSFKFVFEYLHSSQLTPMKLTDLIETERHDIEFLAVFTKAPALIRNQLSIEQVDSQIRKMDRAPAFGLVKSTSKVIRNRLRNRVE